MQIPVNKNKGIEAGATQAVLWFAPAGYLQTIKPSRAISGYLRIIQLTLVSQLVVSVFVLPFLYSYLQRQSGKNGIEIGNRPVLAILKQVAEIKLKLSLAQQEIEMRKHAEKERDMLIEALKKSLSAVKTSRGFLPICRYARRSGMTKATGTRSKRISWTIPKRGSATAYAGNGPGKTIPIWTSTRIERHGSEFPADAS